MRKVNRKQFYKEVKGVESVEVYENLLEYYGKGQIQDLVILIPKNSQYYLPKNVIFKTMSVEKIIKYEKGIRKERRLGRKLVIPKNTIVEIEPPHTIEYCTEVVSLIIGIGNDHTADLIMDKEAWKVFKKGARIDL